MIVDKILDYLKREEKTLDESIRYEVEKLAGWIFKRQFMTDDEADTKGKLRLSSCGKCPRQLAYAYHGVEKKGKELDPRAKLVFWTGDLVELTVVNLAKLAGCNIVGTGLNQMSLQFPVNGGTISGHPDGVLFHEKEQFLIEIKSMSSYSFERFEKGEIDFAYECQMNAYMEALGLSKCVMVALNKDSGVMSERVVEKNAQVVEFLRENLKSVMHSTTDKLPERMFKPDDKGFYPWNCLYCAWWGVCLTNAERVLVRNSYKLKEKA